MMAMENLILLFSVHLMELWYIQGSLAGFTRFHSDKMVMFRQLVTLMAIINLTLLFSDLQMGFGIV